MSEYDDFLRVLKGAGLRVRDVVSITGFRLDGVRLYLDEGELSWIEFDDAAFVHSRPHSEDASRLGLITVWVRREANTTLCQLTDAEDIMAGFLKPSNIGGMTAPGWSQNLAGFVRPIPKPRPGPFPSPHSALGPCIPGLI